MDDNDHSKGYEGDQIALINNNIVFTDNGFETVKMAIGRFKDETRGSCFGVVAPNIVGTLLASKKLMIQAKTEDNKTVLFQVDENGAKLHNAEFNIFAHGNQLSLNPDIGIAMGKEPIYTKTENGVEIKKENASFYADIETGDAFFKGTIRAAKYLDQNGEEMMVGDDDYRFKSDYLSLYGLEIKNKSGTTTFQIDQNGHVTMQGDITINNGAPDGTFISGTNIYAPMIESPKMIWYQGDGSELGEMRQTSGDDGVNHSTVLLGVLSKRGLTLQAEGGGMSLKARDGIWFTNSIHMKDGAHIYTHLTNEDGAELTLTAYLGGISGEINQLKNAVKSLQEQISN